MAKPTPREHEQLGLTLDEHTARNRALIAQALAEHREDVLRRRDDLDSKSPATSFAGNEGG